MVINSFLLNLSCVWIFVCLFCFVLFCFWLLLCAWILYFIFCCTFFIWCVLSVVCGNCTALKAADCFADPDDKWQFSN